MNNVALQAGISNPRNKLKKTYLVQVDSDPTESGLNYLREGVMVDDGKSLPLSLRNIQEPPFLWKRNPPISYRK